MQGEAHLAALAERASVVQKNNKAGIAKEKVKHLCVRTFGPHQPILDGNGEIIQPSTRGHPLGPNRPLHLPSALTVAVPFVAVTCPAEKYVMCTSRCLLCGD